MPPWPFENLGKVCENSRAGENLRLRLGFSLIYSRTLTGTENMFLKKVFYQWTLHEVVTKELMANFVIFSLCKRTIVQIQVQQVRGFNDNSQKGAFSVTSSVNARFGIWWVFCGIEVYADVFETLVNAFDKLDKPQTKIIILLFSISAWVLLSPPIKCRETRPTV